MKATSTRFRWAAAAAFAALALVVVPAASSAGQYGDPAGDANGAGDVTAVTVTAEKQSGQVVFRISGTNMASSESNLLSLFVDSDANPETGSSIFDGADYWFIVDVDSYWFMHWDGADWVDTSSSSVSVSGGTTQIAISVNRSELANSRDFNFVASTLDITTFDGDDAPDEGAFNFSIEANGPQIDAVDVKTTPTNGPRAGKRFVIMPTGLKLPPDGRTDATPPAPESYTCTAKLGSRALVGTGTGRCAFAVPKKARGKRLTVQLTVNYQGAAKTVALTFKVA